MSAVLQTASPPPPPEVVVANMSKRFGSLAALPSQARSADGAYARDVSVLRHGRLAGQGSVRDLGHGDMVRMMIGRENLSPPAARSADPPGDVALQVRGFGLDLNAVAEIRNRIMEARNDGAAVLLISEDLDEIMELADRIVMMFEGRFVYETLREDADIHIIGRHMSSRIEEGALAHA